MTIVTTTVATSIFIDLLSVIEIITTPESFDYQTAVVDWFTAIKSITLVITMITTPTTPVDGASSWSIFQV